MQERRATIRFGHLRRIHYCSSTHPFPRDGWLTNLSECGAGLLAKDSPQCGDSWTISLWLNGKDDGLTLTGRVQWIQPDALRGSWYWVGLEWLALEDSQRNRLEITLRHPPFMSNLRSWPRPPQFLSKNAVVCWLIAGLLGIGALGYGLQWPGLLRQENRYLFSELKRRDIHIAGLKDRQHKLQQELDHAQSRLAVTSEEVARLDWHTQSLERAMQQVKQDIKRVYAMNRALKHKHDQWRQLVREMAMQRAVLTAHSLDAAAVSLASSSRLSSNPTPDTSAASSEQVELYVHEPQAGR